MSRPKVLWDGFLATAPADDPGFNELHNKFCNDIPGYRAVVEKWLVRVPNQGFVVNAFANLALQKKSAVDRCDGEVVEDFRVIEQLLKKHHGRFFHYAGSGFLYEEMPDLNQSAIAAYETTMKSARLFSSQISALPPEAASFRTEGAGKRANLSKQSSLGALVVVADCLKIPLVELISDLKITMYYQEPAAMPATIRTALERARKFHIENYGDALEYMQRNNIPPWHAAS